MGTEIRVPPLGESVVEATVARWIKREGESVSEGEPVVELETEKVSLEVAAERSGVLTRIAKPEGSTVRVGEVLGEIGEPGQMVTVLSGQPSEGEAEADKPTAPAVTRGVSASPVARRLAEEQGVDLTQIKGTGPGGRVMKEDVLAYLESQRQGWPAPSATAAEAPTSAPPAAPSPRPEAPPAELPIPRPAGAREERIRLSRRRLTIARRLLEAQQTAAMLTTFNEIDMGAVMDIRRRHREAFRQRYGVDLGLMSFFTKAVVAALKAFPRLNAEIQGEEMVIKHYYDIGIAVDTEAGLVVPVVRDADRKTFAEIEREITDLATRARENRLTLSDLQGGTFTITNGGIFGSLLSTPILNMPQVGILGMHRIQERPVVRDGQIVIRPMMYVALTYDHRIVDGREAVLFLVRVKELIENPEALLLEG